MNLRKIFTLWAVALLSVNAFGTIELTATYTDSKGTEVKETGNFNANAPLHVRFTADVGTLEEGATYEWHITNEKTGMNLTRYDEEIEFDFVESGVTTVTVNIMMDGVVVETASISVTISESKLEMPNAFSPNDDEINDWYQAKSTSQSIVEFHAYIFNRWGQKLYDWTDWTDQKAGWDGKHNGNPVKDGVYYVYVKARGADGIVYEIRRDVNLIRNHNKSEEATSNEQ
jgi:gliding motility-associated-like protein